MNTSIKLPKLIGLSGTFASGKDTLARYLRDECQFHSVSMGDIVREMAEEKYGNKRRETLQKTATELRQNQGADFLMIKCLEKPRPLVVNGIRSLGEMKKLRESGGIMVSVDADAKIRYERMKSRARISDGETVLTFAEFLAGEKNELHSGDSDADFNIRAIGEMADVRVDNNGTPEEFIVAALNKLAKFA